jgi:HlyD family secretion protein
MYYDKNQIIKSGENIVKYTNGTYFTAPYDCVITAYSVPDSGELCTNSHYITLQSVNTLQMSLEVEEDKLDTVYLGQEAKINVDTISDKTYTGYVTNISNTATYSSSGSTFAVTVEFQNDGDIMLGMSATCEVVLEKAENVIAVASDAITKNRGQSSTVEVKKENGDTETVEIETGISNDAYTEVKSGLEEGDIVLIEKSTSTTGFGRFSGGGKMQDAGGGGSMPADIGGGMQGGDMQKMDKPSGDFQMK